jgi:RimJ/RimL family protein N-acetyltransferase
MNNKNIEKKLFLRPLKPSDIQYTLKWHNNSVLYQSLIGAFNYVSIEAEEIWLKQRMKYDRNNHSLIICLFPNEEPIGIINLREIDWTSRYANLGIFIGEPDLHGKGYGTLAVNEMLKFAFSELGLNRVELKVLADNKAAICAYQKCGFKVEGTLRKRVFKAGIFKDAFIMSVLQDEWIDVQL